MLSDWMVTVPLIPEEARPAASSNPPPAPVHTIKTLFACVPTQKTSKLNDLLHQKKKKTDEL